MSYFIFDLCRKINSEIRILILHHVKIKEHSSHESDTQKLNDLLIHQCVPIQAGSDASVATFNINIALI